MTRRHMMTLFLIALGSSTALTWASAQPRGRGDFRGGRGHRPGAMLRELDLTDAQREQIRSLMDDGMARESHKLVMEKRRALNEAVESGADEGTLQQLGYDLGMAEGEAAITRARVHGQVMEILTDEQRQELQAIKEERKQKMEERQKRWEERRQNRRDRDPDSN